LTFQVAIRTQIPKGGFDQVTVIEFCGELPGLLWGFGFASKGLQHSSMLAVFGKLPIKKHIGKLILKPGLPVSSGFH